MLWCLPVHSFEPGHGSAVIHPYSTGHASKVTLTAGWLVYIHFVSSTLPCPWPLLLSNVMIGWILLRRTGEFVFTVGLYIVTIWMWALSFHLFLLVQRQQKMISLCNFFATSNSCATDRVSALGVFICWIMYFIRSCSEAV